jgi:hypothetical protein
MWMVAGSELLTEAEAAIVDGAANLSLTWKPRRRAD